MEDFQVFAKPVGAACNMACSYCYYLKYAGNNNVIAVMPDGLLEEYITEHIKASTGPEIFFSWHGGEPTLAGLDFFGRVREFQRKHLPENFSAINGIQTNGTLLTDTWCRFLKKENFLVGISIDGPERFYSLHRKDNFGRSQYNRVLESYYLLRRYKIPCEILCVVNSANVKYPEEVYHFFKELKAEYITFLPLVVTSGRGKIRSGTVNARAFGEFLCKIYEEWKSADIGTIKIQIIEEALRTAFDLEHSLCIFKKTCGRVPVIEKNGDFYSCDHFSDPSHLIGNIWNADLSELLENSRQVAFGRLKYETLPQYCLECDVLDMCNGGCPKDRFINTPDDNPGLNYLCEGYRLFFNRCRPLIQQIAEIRENQPRSAKE